MGLKIMDLVVVSLTVCRFNWSWIMRLGVISICFWVYEILRVDEF